MTNDFGFDTTPTISNFYLIDQQEQPLSGEGQRLLGVHRREQLDEPLKQDEKREYTVGFRTTDPNVTGTIFYER